MKGNCDSESLLRYVVSCLVGKDVEVGVWISETSKQSIIHVCVGAEHVGKLVGEDGTTVQAIHTLLNAVSKTQGKHITLKMEPKVDSVSSPPPLS